MGGRIVWIDYAKSLCMFLVILGHTHLQESQHFVIQVIYSFHLPLFFALSGLLCKCGLSFAALKKDATFLLLPYMFYGIINLLFQTIISRDTGQMFLGFFALCEGLDESIGPIWFLPALFVCKIVAQILFLIKERCIWLYYVLATSTSLFIFFFDQMHINLPLFADSGLCGLPFFILGHEYMNMTSSRKNILLTQKNSLIIASIALLLTICLASKNEVVVLAICQYGSNFFIYYANALAGCVFMLSLSQFAARWTNRFIFITSYGSIFTLGMHGLVLSFFNYYFPKMLGLQPNNYGLALAFVYAIITYMVCYYLIIKADHLCPQPFGLRGHLR